MAISKVPVARARRSWSIAEKQRIVELSFREGSSISAVARSNGVQPHLLSEWRKKYRNGNLGCGSARISSLSGGARHASLVPVTIVPGGESTPGRHGGVVELTFSCGATLRIQTDALDAGLLCALVAQLQR